MKLVYLLHQKIYNIFQKWESLQMFLKHHLYMFLRYHLFTIYLQAYKNHSYFLMKEHLIKNLDRVMVATYLFKKFRICVNFFLTCCTKFFFRTNYISTTFTGCEVICSGMSRGSSVHSTSILSCFFLKCKYWRLGNDYYDSIYAYHPARHSSER